MQNEHFPNSYKSYAYCRIRVRPDTEIWCTAFDTHSGTPRPSLVGDTLSIDGRAYHGLDGPLGNFTAEEIVWSTDWLHSRMGWQLCDTNFTTTTTTWMLGWRILLGLNRGVALLVVGLVRGKLPAGILGFTYPVRQECEVPLCSVVYVPWPCFSLALQARRCSLRHRQGRLRSDAHGSLCSIQQLRGAWLSTRRILPNCGASWSYHLGHRL